MSVTSVILPKLGLTMDEGKLVAWLKQEGDRIEAGEILFEVETDKATMEVESPVAGYVRKLLAAAGETVPVTQVIALISATAETGGRPVGAVEPERPAAVEAPVPPPVASGPRTGGSSRVPRPASAPRSSAWTWPGSARRRATGSRSRTSRPPMPRRARGPPDRAGAGPGTGASPRAPLSRMRRAIVERMTLSLRDVPQFSVSCDVDMTAANAARTAAGVSTPTC